MSDSENSDQFDVESPDPENDYLVGKKNVAIILLDCSPSMFDTPRIFKTCLLAIYQLLDTLLLKSHKRNISICLLRHHDIILTALNTNLLESTKIIYNLLRSSIVTLRSKFVRNNRPSFQYTITECSKQFQNLQKVNPYIVILTNDEDPIKGDQNELLNALDVALYLKQLNVKLVVLPLKKKFNYSIFYKNFLQTANDAVGVDIYEDETSTEALTDILESILKNKVNLIRYKFRMFKEEQPYFWVQMRSFINNSNFNKKSTKSRITNSTLKKGNKHVLNKNKPYFEDEGYKINLNQNDYMYLTMPDGFQLLYVSEKKQLEHYLEKVGFLLQFDETHKNNKGLEIFNNMWEYCKNKQRYLVCGFKIPGTKQRPHMVELSADTFHLKPCFVAQYLLNNSSLVLDQDEEVDEKIDQNDPNLGLICDMIDKMKIKKFPYHWSDIDYELKASKIKAQLLDIKAQEVESDLPTAEEVTQHLGATYTELQAIFRRIDEPAPKKRSKK